MTVWREKRRSLVQLKIRHQRLVLDLQGLNDGKGMIVTDVSLKTVRVGWLVNDRVFPQKQQYLSAFLPNGHRGKSDTITIRDIVTKAFLLTALLFPKTNTATELFLQTTGPTGLITGFPAWMILQIKRAWSS